jgi:hypothetical protein
VTNLQRFTAYDYFIHDFLNYVGLADALATLKLCGLVQKYVAQNQETDVPFP